MESFDTFSKIDFVHLSTIRRPVAVASFSEDVLNVHPPLDRVIRFENYTRKTSSCLESGPFQDTAKSIECSVQKGLNLIDVKVMMGLHFSCLDSLECHIRLQICMIIQHH